VLKRVTGPNRNLPPTPNGRHIITGKDILSNLVRLVELWSTVRVVTITPSSGRGLLTPRDNQSSELCTKAIHTTLHDVLQYPGLLASKSLGHVPVVVQSTSTSSTTLTIVKLWKTIIACTRGPGAAVSASPMAHLDQIVESRLIGRGRGLLRTHTPIPIFVRPGSDHILGRMNQMPTARRMLWPSAM
jgi:hypothetical protein